MDYEKFKNVIFDLFDIDLTSYKEKQMKRRIDALISKYGYKTYEDFYYAVKNDKNMADIFINYITINVSEFYRNPNQWMVLENQILPHLFKNFGKRITIWSAACSTGDEPYTLVMLMAKYVPMEQIHVIATDIDENVINKAKIGVYDKRSISSLPEEYIKKYFKKIDESTYELSNEIKKHVEFRKHNLLKDKYLDDVELIVCRNVLIYFTEEAKNNIYRNFNKSLKNNGILFIGSTEQIIGSKEIGFKNFNSFFYEKIL